MEKPALQECPSISDNYRGILADELKFCWCLDTNSSSLAKRGWDDSHPLGKEKNKQVIEYTTGNHMLDCGIQLSH